MSMSSQSIEDVMRALIARALELENSLDRCCSRKGDFDAAALMIVAIRSFAGRDAATATAEAFARGFAERTAREP